MPRPQCPVCASTRTIPHIWVLARRSALAALILFWVGLIAMLILGLQGMARLGAEIWLGLTAAPILVFLVDYARRQHVASYRDGRRCENCGHRWVLGEVTAAPALASPVTEQRLLWLAEQRAAQPPVRPPGTPKLPHPDEHVR